MDDSDSKSVSGLNLSDKKRLLSELLTSQKNSGAATRGAAPEYKISDFPEVAELQAREDAVVPLGIRNPYFISHEGPAGATSIINGREFINFSNYNYLCLSGHRDVTSASTQAVEKYGTSVSASRVISGERPIHRELEAELAGLTDSEASLVFVGGYVTNETVIGHLLGPDDLIVCDALCHASIMHGSQLSGASRMPFPHNDCIALEKILSEQRLKHRRCLVVVEGLYSMDGDTPDLKKIIAIKNRHKSLLMVDEAHSAGVLGDGFGVARELDIDPKGVDIWMGTLSKSFASCGGYISGQANFIKYLKYTTPGFVYSVGLSPANAGAALAAVKIMKREPERVRKLNANAGLFMKLAQEKGLDTGLSQGRVIVPVIVGDSLKALKVAQSLFDRGINVLPILPPVVSEEETRLRFFLTYEHTEEQIATTVEAVAGELNSNRGAA